MKNKRPLGLRTIIADLPVLSAEQLGVVNGGGVNSGPTINDPVILPTKLPTIPASIKPPGQPDTCTD